VSTEEFALVTNGINASTNVAIKWSGFFEITISLFYLNF
jgi:hypothetical protein